MSILGGKEHRAVFIDEPTVGAPPNGTEYYYPGLLKEYKLTHGLNITDLTGLGSEWPQGWSKEGYNPALSATIQPAGEHFYNLISPALDDNIKSQTWEIWKGAASPGGYKAALAIGAVHKGITLNKEGYTTPLSLSIDMIARYIQITDQMAGASSEYKGFVGSNNSPLYVQHPEPEIKPWLGAHVREVVKIDGAEETPAPLRSWALQITRDISAYMGRLTGADGNIYTLPAAYSEQKATAALIINLGANNWTWWERSYNGEPVEYVDLIFTPPGGLSGVPSKKIRLSNGIIKPFDLDIKELSALEYPARLEFEGVELLNA